MRSKSLARVHRPKIGPDGRVINPFISTRESGTIPVAQAQGEGTADEAILSGQVEMEQSTAAPALQQQQQSRYSEYKMRRIDQALQKGNPDFKVVLDSYFDIFQDLVNSSNGVGERTYYSMFTRILRNYFFPDHVTLWNYNFMTKKCEDHGKRGDHQKYRDFLCYIIRNAENFTALECGKLSHLLMRIMEEEAISRVTYITSDGNEDVIAMLELYKKHFLQRNGRHTFCKGNKIVYHGWAVSNTIANTIVEEAMKKLFSFADIQAAEGVIASIIVTADARRYRHKEMNRSTSIGTAVAAAAGDGGMEAAEGGSNRSRRVPIRRKSANRRTPRRRNNTRKYYKK